MGMSEVHYPRSSRTSRGSRLCVKVLILGRTSITIEVCYSPSPRVLRKVLKKNLQRLIIILEWRVRRKKSFLERNRQGHNLWTSSRKMSDQPVSHHCV